ncbi:MAG: type II toxin-antitoxin system RelE/ParE family toxin [Fibromonadaceae bacterium]|jgi:proteic killer suppression protein|nr:type II toxin-antitoxin system RelE/ParE family toxin [Fibromonadaceae bacterium]
MIKSFKNKETKKIFHSEFSKKIPQNIQHRALHRMEMLNNAANINDLRIPLSNHLEALSGNRAGQFSIRVNDQYRICFEWANGGAENVELVDYH